VGGHPFLSAAKIDEVLVDIDRKLAKLDEEEKENRTEQNKESQ